LKKIFPVYTNNDITSFFHTYLFLRSIPERCILEAPSTVLSAFHTIQPASYSGIPEYRTVKKLGERQIIHRWNRNDV